MDRNTDTSRDARLREAADILREQREEELASEANRPPIPVSGLATALEMVRDRENVRNGIAHLRRVAQSEDWQRLDVGERIVVVGWARLHAGGGGGDLITATLGSFDRRRQVWIDPRVPDAPTDEGIPWQPVSEVIADDAWAAHASGVAFPARMTLFSGHRKQGKSTLIAAVAAGIADGADWLTGEEIDAGSVVWFGGPGESTPADVQLMAADAGGSTAARSRIHFAPVMRSDRMAAALIEYAPDDLRLVVIDSGRSLITADGGKENDADSIRLSLGPNRSMAG